MLGSTRTNFLPPCISAAEKKNRSLLDRFRGASQEPTNRETMTMSSELTQPRYGSGLEARHLNIDSSRLDRNEYTSTIRTGIDGDGQFTQSQELILPESAQLTQDSTAKINTVDTADNEQRLRKLFVEGKIPGTRDRNLLTAESSTTGVPQTATPDLKKNNIRINMKQTQSTLQNLQRDFLNSQASSDIMQS